MGGDENLCRAFMPFRCRDREGQEYNFRDPIKRREWNTKEWFLPDGSRWTPTDVHSTTAHGALLALGYECLEPFKHYIAPNGMAQENRLYGNELAVKILNEIDPDTGERKIYNGFKKKARPDGKMVNFLANYGGTKKAIMEQKDIPEVGAEALVKGYKAAYPGVTTYQRAIQERHAERGYVHNMYGRRYYLEDPRWSYRLANYCVQGTCADMMKICMIEIDRFLIENNCRTRMVLTVHDELQFEVWAGEEWVVEPILAIMQTHDWHLVPIVSDIEIATENWAEKREIKLEEVSQRCAS